MTLRLDSPAVALAYCSDDFQLMFHSDLGVDGQHAGDVDGCFSPSRCRCPADRQAASSLDRSPEKALLFRRSICLVSEMRFGRLCWLHNGPFRKLLIIGIVCLPNCCLQVDLVKILKKDNDLF